MRLRQSPSPRSTRRFLGRCLAAVLVLLILLGCAMASAPTTVSEAPAPQETQPGDTQSQPTPAAVPTAVPAVPEYRMVTLEWPEKIHAGDSAEIRLSLEIDEHGNLVPTAEVEGNTVTGKVVEIPNLYETHQVFAEARLDMAGLDVRPAELVSQPLLPGRAVHFYWSMKPTDASKYQGRIWLYLRFVDKATGAERQEPIYNQRIEVRSMDFLGLSGTPARVMGGIGTVLGSAISLDGIVAFLWKRLRQRRTLGQAR